MIGGQMPDLDFEQFDVLTFDCYGTLIDWEAGILAALRAPLAAHGIEESAERLLESLAHAESQAEAGPYQSYRGVLGDVLSTIISEFDPAADADADGQTLEGEERASFVEIAERDAFAASVKDWPAFHDSVPALAR